MPPRPFPRLIALAALPLLSACATSPPAAGSKAPMAAESPAAASAAPMAPAPAEEVPPSVEGARAALDAAEREIDALFGRPGKEAKDKADADQLATAKKRAEKPGDAQVQSRPEPQRDACSTACRALASMQRSADHLCSLAGNQDARCEDARVRVKAATDRVKASCPTCAPR